MNKVVTVLIEVLKYATVIPKIICLFKKAKQVDPMKCEEDATDKKL